MVSVLIGGSNGGIDQSRRRARTYAPRLASVSESRHFVEDALADLDAMGSRDDAVLCASELVTNAVLHARTDFEIAVERRRNRLLVSVRDESPQQVAIFRHGQHPAGAMTGRGLLVV